MCVCVVVVGVMGGAVCVFDGGRGVWCVVGVGECGVWWG